MTIYESLHWTARQRGRATALRYGSEVLSYAELLRRVDTAAARLRGCGIAKGDAYAVICENCLELMIAYYATAKLGAVFVPINPNLTAPEVAHIAAHSGARMLLHDAAMGAVAQAAVAEAVLRPVSVLTEETGNTDPEQCGDVRAEDDFLIIYTSGSTGAPKAVVFAHTAEIAGNASLIDLWGITPEDITLVALPLGYLYGLSTAAAAGLQAGGEVVVLRRFHPGEVLEALAASRATIFHGVPTMYSMMLEYAEQRGLNIDLSFIRALICAGAPLSPEMKQRFAKTFRKDIQDYYALTEVRPVFGAYAKDPAPVPPGSIGKPAPGVSARILDENHMDCAVGIQGELVVRAPSTLKRYHKDASLTLKSMFEGGFRTGDIGYLDEQGFYYLTGRIKDIIIRGGANIAPAEVEGVLARHPSVQDVAVIGIPDRIFGEVPAAYVVKRRGAEVTSEELVAHARLELADFKVPKHFAFAAELPLGKTGKVDKNALKARWKDGTVDS